MDKAAIDHAVALGVSTLRAAQADDGHFAEACDLGPRFTAHWLAIEAFLGGLSPSDRDAGVAALLSLQLEDGGWGPCPAATVSEASATAACRVALRHCGLPGDHPAARRADTWLAANGGLAAADAESRPLLAFTGDLSPDEVGAPPGEILLLPDLPHLVAKVFVAEVIVTMYATAGLVLGLKHRREMPSLLHPLDHAAARRVLEFLDETRNPVGGTWLGVFPSTAMAVVALLALGVPPSDPRVVEGRAALASRVNRTGRFFVAPISSEIWATCTGLSALVSAGVPAADPAVQRGVAFLLGQEIRRPVPTIFTTPPSSPAIQSGWPFETDNQYGPDCDCTAMVIRTLHHVALPGQTPVFEAVERGLGWLLSMQNPDGGWPAFSWGHASKPPGVVMTEPPPDPRTVWSAISMITDPPLGLGDPSTEALTGRVLTALAQLGLDGSHPAVQRAVVFLREQQAAPGRWWGRWDCNFTAPTAAVVRGLAAVGQGGALVDDAAAWLYACQGAGGGWGELPDSYAHPERFGIGPPTPTQTALVLQGLVATGRGNDAEARRAAAWLAATVTGDGWVDPYPVFTVLPPTKLYPESLAPTALATRALCAFRDPGPPALLGEVPSPPVPSIPARVAAWLATANEGLRAQATGTPEEPGDWTMVQSWAELVYCSYPVDPDVVRPLLPPGLALDTFRGKAWISLVPMVVTEQRVRGLPRFPGMAPMQELNVRTYVRQGTVAGVWFASVNVDRDWMVALGRATGVNYQSIGATRDGAGGFTATRTNGAALSLAVEGGGVEAYARPGTLEAFLTRRLAMFTFFDGKLHRAALSHAPERLRQARARVSDASLVVADGLPAPPADVHALAVGDLVGTGWAPVPV